MTHREIEDRSRRGRDGAMSGAGGERKRSAAVLLWIALLAAPASAQLPLLSPERAAEHVGEHATVCGVVAGASYRADVRGEPTFLNFGAPYPRHVFTALVWGEHRARFATPPESYEGKPICVTGRVSSHRGKPQIVVDSPAQITLGDTP
jgi:hypothetical protein